MLERSVNERGDKLECAIEDASFVRVVARGVTALGASGSAWHSTIVAKKFEAFLWTAFTTLCGASATSPA